MAIHHPYTRIRVSYEKGVVRVVLARPDVRNAFDAETIAELTTLFTEVGHTPETRGARLVLLSGEGASFCSGADLSYMKSMAAFSADENRADAGRLFNMFEAVRACELPVLVHVHGHAMGGALGITACADIALAEIGTQFRFSEVRLGIMPAVISPFILQKVQPGIAKRWMMTGELFEADDAMRAGLVQFVGTGEQVVKEKERLVAALLEAAPDAVRMTKRLLRDVNGKDPNDVKDLITDAIAEKRISPEGQEGLSAFFEKREPSWRKS